MTTGIEDPASGRITESEQAFALHRAINGLRDDDPMRSASVSVVALADGGWCGVRSSS